ncbi:MAG: MerR family transcriptional regulator [Chloroflexota bacterium]
MTTVNVATKRKSLYIKDVAKLVGVTTKTVRHYHKIGLLPEPERTEADYRLYSGWDLWRLRTICELRRLGLSLERIRTVLEATEPADALRSILATQLDEIETEMVELAERKERIQELMSQEHINVDLVNGQPDLYTNKILAKYGDLIPEDLDESLLQFEREFEDTMATFPGHDGRNDIYPPAMALIEENPEQYQHFAQEANQLWIRSSEIKDLDDESKSKISNMVNSFVNQNRYFLQAMTQLSPEGASESSTDAVFGEMVNEKMEATLTPAQFYLVTCLGEAADSIRTKPQD